MGDVTDCLSAAYNCVSHLIAGNPRWAEEPQWQGFEDRSARDRWMPWLAVDLDENEQFVYALASVPGYAGSDVLIGLEAGWLAILAQRKTDGPLERTPSKDGARSCVKGRSGAAEAAPAHTFCVMSLPAEVNPIQSVAVLAKGVLGIRMPKARP